MIDSPIVCVDDYGTALYRCRFTTALVGGANAKLCGAVMPGVKARYVMGNSDEAVNAKRLSDQTFHESEANCNTCGHLKREGHEKIKGGFLLGRCDNPMKVPTPYAERSPGLMVFHPDDPMNMSCYVSRWALKSEPNQPPALDTRAQLAMKGIAT